MTDEDRALLRQIDRVLSATERAIKEERRALQIVLDRNNDVASLRLVDGVAR